MKKINNLSKLLILTTLVSCGGGVNTTSQPSNSSINPSSMTESNIQLNFSEKTIKTKEKFLLKLENVDEKLVKWSSSHIEVVKVTNGLIEGLSEGKSTISAVYNYKIYNCEVTVEKSEDKSQLLFSDEFNGSSLDENKWEYQLGNKDHYHGKESGPINWGNNEKQYYTKENAVLNDGYLHILGKKEEKEGYSYTSSRITTRDRFSITYGYIEARIKIDAVEGFWPAFWMLPQPSDFSSTHNEYGGWAAAGEIDIMEARGRNPNEVETTIHFGGQWPNNTLNHKSHNLTKPINDFHVYAVDWREDYIAWYIDDIEVYKLTNDKWYSVNGDTEAAPFDKPFYILLNLAIGGNYDGNRLPPSSFTEGEMVVDYLRVYN